MAQNPPPIIELNFEKGLLTANIQKAPLTEIMARIGSELGIRIFLSGSLKPPINMSFSRIPLDMGIRRLTKGHSVVMIYRSGGSDDGHGTLTEITEIWVIEGDGQGGIELTEHAPSGEIAANPTLNMAEEPLPKKTVKNGPISRIEFVAPEDQSKEETDAGTWSRTMVTDQDVLDRQMEMNALQQIGSDPAVLAIANTLKEDDISMRHLAVENLGRIDSDRATQILGQVVFGDRDPDIRLAAVHALTYQNSEASRVFLKAATKDTDSRVRAAAMKALGLNAVK